MYDKELFDGPPIGHNKPKKDVPMIGGFKKPTPGRKREEVRREGEQRGEDNF